MKTRSTITKFSALAFCVFICGALTAAAQTSDQAVELEKEPHHKLILEKRQMRVFRLVLQPNEATLLHWHSHPYAFLSLKDASVSNELPGRPPVARDLKAGELHTSKGGFVLSERNTSNLETNLIIRKNC